MLGCPQSQAFPQPSLPRTRQASVPLVSSEVLIRGLETLLVKAVPSANRSYSFRKCAPSGPRVVGEVDSPLLPPPLHRGDNQKPELLVYTELPTTLLDFNFVFSAYCDLEQVT